MPLTAVEELHAGLSQHQAGNLAAAAGHYCETLRQIPDNADALHLLGLVLSEQGDHGHALSFLSRAIQISPNATFLANLGLAFRRAGDLEAAIQSYREALRMDPRQTSTLGKLGRVLIEAKRPAEAEAVLLEATCSNPAQAELRNALGHARAAQSRFAEAYEDFQAALRLDPSYAEARGNGALALLELGHVSATGGDWSRAYQLYENACQLAPSMPEAWYHGGLAASALRRLPEARRSYERAIALSFNYAEAHNNLGHIHEAEGDAEEAIRAYECALAIRPEYADAHYNLALTLQNNGRVPAAKAQYESLLAYAPEHADARNNLGGIYLSENRVTDAIQEFERALTEKPTHVDARWNLSLALLSQAEFRRGWQLYETRLEQPSFPRRDFRCPRWRGQRLEGRSICVWAEQGLGDTLQFMRYVPLLVEMGARVTLEVQPRLLPLLQSLPGIEVVARSGEPREADFHIPLLSLAGCFENIPPVWWPLSLPAIDLSSLPGYKMGLCWAANPDHIKGRNRSAKLEQLRALAHMQGVTFVSLQRGPAAGEVQALAAAWNLEQVESQEGSIADLASLMQGLDVIVTVDTMTAHLAATLGRPVWTMLPYAADWRWQMDRSDSPWYPSMRLVRQSAPGDWTTVAEQVAQELTSSGKLHAV